VLFCQIFSQRVKSMRFLMDDQFEYMVTYLSHPDIPRCGNRENMIRERALQRKYGLDLRLRKGNKII